MAGGSLGGRKKATPACGWVQRRGALCTWDRSGQLLWDLEEWPTWCSLRGCVQISGHWQVRQAQSRNGAEGALTIQTRP